MQKILLALCLLFSKTVYAEEPFEIDVTDTAVGEVSTAVKSKENLLPTCDDQQLIAQTASFLQEYNKKNPVDSLYAKRQRALRLRSVQAYDEQQVEGFTAKQNRAVADKLLMTKINFGMEDSDFRICRSQKNNLRFAPVYLLIYQNRAGKTEVYVMNFLDLQPEDLMFILKK